MKTELILLLIHLVSLTLAAVVPAVNDKVTAVAKKKDVIITSTPSVESAESIESLRSNDPKVISGITPTEKNQENESAESTDSIVSAESTESSVLDNVVLKTSSTFHRRYHYPRYPQYYRRPVVSGYHNRYPQYYRRPVASGYYNRYPQAHTFNRYSYNRPSLPVYYTQPNNYWSQYDSASGSSGGDSGGDGGGVSGGDSSSSGGDGGGGGDGDLGVCRRKRGSRSKRCGA